MEIQTITKTRVTLVGHPFVPIGMGEQLRSVFRAFRALGMNVGVRDVYGTGSNDPDLRQEFSGQLVQELSPEVNLFCLNGDEVEPSLKQLSGLPKSALNIIYPAWELSKYPRDWAEQLNRFDEVWTASTFTQQAIQSSVSKPVSSMALPGEIRLSTFLARRYFKIPESSFVFLFFFDFTSYMERKNPFAVLRAFEELCRRRPDDDLYLVVKVKGGEGKKKDCALFYEHVARYKGRLMVIDKVLTDNEVKNLLRCCDCFVSLHRSEGFGLGLTAAMFLGKPVIATGYSGNLDFMNEGNSCLVRYKLSNVPDGAYPFSEGQVWAEPDITHAVDYMSRLAADRGYALGIGENASRYIRINFSYQATGLRYLERIREILALRSASPTHRRASGAAAGEGAGLSSPRLHLDSGAGNSLASGS